MKFGCDGCATSVDILVGHARGCPFAPSIYSNMETFGRLDLIGEKVHPRIDPIPSYKLLSTMVIHINIKSLTYDKKII